MSVVRAALLATTLGLAACAPTGGRDVEAVNASLTLADQQQDACYGELRSDPVMDRVLTYLVIDAEDPDKARKLKDRRRVDATMRQDLIQAHEKIRACREAAEGRFTAIDPAYGRVLALTHEAEDSILLALLNRKLRIGEANQRSLELDQLSDTAWDATTSSIITRPDDTPAALTLRDRLAAGALQQLAAEREELAGLSGAADGGCRLAEGRISCGPS